LFFPAHQKNQFGGLTPRFRYFSVTIFLLG
jgi:hypothetical protein